MISDRREACGKPCAKLGHTVVPAKGEKGEPGYEPAFYDDCPCLVMDKNERDLGPLFHEEAKFDTTLRHHWKENLILEGTREMVSRHMAGAAVHLLKDHKKVAVVDTQRLVDIWFDSDEEGVRSSRRFTYPHLLIFYLGVGELPNKRLPEVILNIIDLRRLERKATWVYMDFDYGELSTRYKSELLGRRLGPPDFQRTDLDE